MVRSRMKSRREFQTVRPATEKARRQAVSVEMVANMLRLFLCVSATDVYSDNATSTESQEGATSATHAGSRVRHCTSSSEQRSVVQTEKEMLLIGTHRSMLMFTLDCVNMGVPSGGSDRPWSAQRCGWVSCILRLAWPYQ